MRELEKAGVYSVILGGLAGGPRSSEYRLKLPCDPGQIGRGHDGTPAKFARDPGQKRRGTPARLADKPLTDEPGIEPGVWIRERWSDDESPGDRSDIEASVRSKGLDPSSRVGRVVVHLLMAERYPHLTEQENAARLAEMMARRNAQ